MASFMLFFILMNFEPVHIFDKLISSLIMYVINTKTHLWDQMYLQIYVFHVDL
jgi:hypothetical protein